MKKLNITDKDWLKLREYAIYIAQKIQKRLPNDWKLDVEDIKSRVFDSYISILNSFNPNGTASAPTYCWKYAEKTTYTTLIAEYRRLKNQDTLYAIGQLEDDDEEQTENTHIAQQPVGSSFPISIIEKEDLLAYIYDNCIEDELTRHAVACMYFLDYSLTQAADECNMSKQTLMKRLRTIGHKCNKKGI